MNGDSFIRELCVALEHRWQPEQRFLLFTAYLDEADTHGPAPTVIMSGFLGTAREWLLFERGLRRLQRRDKFTIFHAKEFKARSGEFRGWHDDKRRGLFGDLAELVRDTLTEGVTIHLEHARYVSEYLAPPFPRKMPKDSQYGLCFRECLWRLVKTVRSDGKRHRLHVVVESGHKNAGNAERIFRAFKKELKENKGIDLLGDFIIASKEEREPLMMGDFLASSYSEMCAMKAEGGLDYIAATTGPPKGGAGITFLEFLPNSLRQMNGQRCRHG